jgi:hypothetical protein
VKPRRRRGSDVTPDQARFAWGDADRVLGDAPAGEVVFEAPEVKRRSRAPAPPVPQTLGLPFGVRQADGRSVCWSCGHDVDDETVVRAGPGDVRCVGCGAKLPFF